jgi:hypothetical protein
MKVAQSIDESRAYFNGEFNTNVMNMLGKISDHRVAIMNNQQCRTNPVKDAGMCSGRRTQHLDIQITSR